MDDNSGYKEEKLILFGGCSIIDYFLFIFTEFLILSLLPRTPNSLFRAHIF